MERRVRTVKYVLHLPDYATMVACGSFTCRCGDFGLGDSVINSRHDKKIRVGDCGFLNHSSHAFYTTRRH